VVIKVLWRVAREAKKYKWLLIVAALSTLLLTGVNLVAPRVLTGMTSMVEAGLSASDLKAVVLLAAALMGLYLLRVLFRFLSNYLAHRAAWNLVQDIRMRVYDKIQSFSMGFFHNRQTGELMSRVVNDTANFELLYAHLMPEMITNIVTIVGVTVMLLTINARLALMTCIPIPFILLSGVFFSKKVRPKFRIMQKALATLSAQLQDNFSGVQEIQAFGQQQRESGKVYEKSNVYTTTMLHALKLSAIFHPSVEFFSALGTVIVVGWGGYLAFQNQLSVSDIVGFLLYLSLFYAPIAGIAQLLESAQQAFAGAERVIEILDTPIEIKDAPDAYELPDLSGKVEFENVSFHYVPEAPVLKNVSFTAQPGQMIALVGPTGVGKTTMIQLLSRFYDPISGSIKVDGHDLKGVQVESLRRQIAPVLQDTFLFNGTIAENIAYACPTASAEQVKNAAKIARIYDDIMDMPDGFNTQVGERGTKLSGGQKQRIAIARAVLRQAPILILDEATASVDVETEAQIQQAIGELTGTRTIIAIAHRLSTIRRADMILVFENGEVVQRGTHDELIAQDGLYRRMCRVQGEAAAAMAANM